MRVDRMLQSRIWGLMLALAIIATLASLPGGAQAPTPAKWTIMAYISADNWTEGAAVGSCGVLATDDPPMSVINRMEASAVSIYTPDVNVVVQLDRITAAGAPWDDTTNGDWETCHRFRITQDLNADNMEIYSDSNPNSDPSLPYDIGEVDMADPQTLIDFVDWAKTNYPAEHYALILWDYTDHWSDPGRSPYGEAPVRWLVWDYTSPERFPWVCYDVATLNDALSGARGVLGKKIDVLAVDSDYMGSMEMVDALSRNVSYLVASELNMGDAIVDDTGKVWGIAGGFDYEWILDALVAFPDLTPEELAQVMGDCYAWLYPPGVIGSEEAPVPALNCSQVPTLVSALSTFANEMTNAFNADPNGPLGSMIHTYWELAYAWADPRLPAGVGDNIDLGCFAELMATTAPMQALKDAANDLVDKLRRVVAYPAFGSRWGVLQGLSIYYPFNLAPPQEYRWTWLAGETAWDEWIRIQPIGWGYYPDSFESDGSTDTATPVDVGYDQGWHWFHRVDDMDVASFTAQAGALYGVGTDNRAPKCYPYMAILDTDGRTVLTESYNPFMNYLLWLCPTSGTYYVVVTQDDQYDVPHYTGGGTYYSLWAAPVRFGDVMPSHWAFRQVAACQVEGLVGGYPDGGYRPWQTVERDQMAVYISRALAGGDKNVPNGPLSPSFGDVSTDHWAYKYIEYAKANGVVGGYPDGSYRPSGQLDRGQMAVFIARGLAGGDAEVPEAGFGPYFRDVPSRLWARRYIQYIAKQGVSTGYPDRTYRPDAVCTRDQMAVFVARAFLPPIKAPLIPQ